MDDTDPTTVNIGTATQLWGCEILCNLQQYMNKYRQQYKSAQGGWYVVQPLGSAEIGLSGGGYGAIHCSMYIVLKVYSETKNVPCTQYNMILGLVC